MKLQISEIVLDYDLYPRVQVDPQHASYMAEAIRAGAKLPPIIIEKKSKRVIDGFHRVRAYRAVHGEKAEIDCEARTYANEREMFIDAMVLNASHGRALTKYDRARCALRCRQFRISLELVAKSLGMSPAAVRALAEGRVATHDKEKVPLKRSIEHMAGRELTDDQQRANERLSGMNQQFYVNQILLLLDADLLDKNDDCLLERLRVLYGRLATLFASDDVAELSSGSLAK